MFVLKIMLLAVIESHRSIFSFNSSNRIIVLPPSKSMVFSLSLILQCFTTVSFFLSVIEEPTGNEESEDPSFFLFLVHN